MATVTKSSNLAGYQPIPKGWKKIHLYCITENDKKYFYRVFDDFIVENIDAMDIPNPTTVSWNDINSALKDAHFKRIDPG